jgi:hypothetical protein
MDYSTAKTLSLIGLIFIGIQLVMGALIGLLMLVQVVVLGALVASGGDAAGIICFVILIFIPLIFLIIPIINLKLALGLNNKIKFQSLDDRDKTRMIWVIVLSFFGGGGIVPAIMFILIIASWDEITRTHFRPVY